MGNGDQYAEGLHVTEDGAHLCACCWRRIKKARYDEVGICKQCEEENKLAVR